MIVLTGWLWLTACTELPFEGAPMTADTGPSYDVPCAVRGEPTLDLAHALEPWGVDGGVIGCGIPPQGGAPYSRFRLRVGNMPLSEGGEVSITATDADTGEVLGGAAFTMGFVCANVGDDADHWVGSEVHVRFDGYAVDDLLSRTIELTASVTTDGTQVTTTGTGTLGPIQ